MRRGLTLLEVAIASAILIVLVGVVFMLMSSGSRTYGDSALQGGVEEAARRAVEEMARELRVADSDTLVLSTYRGCGRLQVWVPQGGPDGRAGERILVEFRYEPPPRETPRAAGRIVRVESGTVRTLAHHARPGCLSFERSGDNVTISLQLEHVDTSDQVRRASMQTSVTLRNRSGR